MKFTSTFRKVDHGWAQAKAALRAIAAKHPSVKVGVLGDRASRSVREDAALEKGHASPKESISNVDLAVIHEYGSPAAHIPERSFLRSAIRNKENRKVYKTIAGNGVKAIMRGTKTVEQVLGLLGAKAAADVKNGITRGEGIPPPLQQATIDRKGSSRPLVDTGQLLNSITWEVDL